jgi:CRP-like cAMP-binding protein/Zn-dependent protease
LPASGRRARRRAPRHAPVWDEVERALLPTEERPRLAGAIESVHQRTRAGLAYVVIHNPANHEYLKLDEEEFDLLPLMDGEHTVKELVIEYYLRHEVLALPRIAGLVRLLKVHGFLAGGYVDAYAELTSKLHRRSATDLVVRLWRGLLQTSIPIPGLDRFFDWLYRAGGWVFFTRPAAVIGVAFLVAGPVFFLAELTSGRYPLFKFGGSYLQGFLLLLVLDVVTISVHEAGHALAMKYAGRFVRRSGVMLYYGMPAAYVDTTDAWMAPRKMRLLVSFAGPWTGVWIGGITAVTAFFLPQGLLGAFLFSWAFVALVDNLFNFCPLLELDGYYLLVDLVEKPMLRGRSFAFVRNELWGRLRTRQPLSPEERFLAFFGLASVAWSVIEIYLVLRIWELRGARLIGEVWATGNPLARAVLVAVLAILSVPLVLALKSLAGWLARELSVEARWARGAATRVAHRDAITALRRVRLAAELPEQRLLEVARHLRPKWIEAGEPVYRAGDPATDFYIIDSGVFEVQPAGHPRQRLGSGEYFGEQALILDGSRESAVVAAESGRLFAIDRDSFHATLEHDVEIRDRIRANLRYRHELAAMPLFRHLTATERDLLLEYFEPLTAEHGTEIVTEGERGDRFYLIRTGTVRVLKQGSEVARLGPGEAFGETALILDVPRTATVRATQRTELLALGSEQFHDLLLGYCRKEGSLERLSHLRMVAHKRSNHEVHRER